MSSSRAVEIYRPVIGCGCPDGYDFGVDKLTDRRGTSRKAAVIASFLIASLGITAPGYPLGIRTLLSEAAHGTPFKIIHVGDLAALMAKRDGSVAVLDANPTEVRQSEGTIPGARLLSSDDKYNVATELPVSKDTPLVFYCYNWH